jgi:hypothetical protein
MRTVPARGEPWEGKEGLVVRVAMARPEEPAATEVRRSVARSAAEGGEEPVARAQKWPRAALPALQ